MSDTKTLHCRRCGPVDGCPSCRGTGMHATTYPSGLVVPTACAECWGTGMQHDLERHPDPDEPRAAGWHGADPEPPTPYLDLRGDEPFNIADTCCGQCPGDTCYVDQITGER